MTRFWFITILVVLATTGCGGDAPTPTTPDVIATSENVEQIIETNDEIAIRFKQTMDYEVHCVGEDAEGRFFRCIGETLSPLGQRVIAHTYEVTCDAAACQWSRY